MSKNNQFLWNYLGDCPKIKALDFFLKAGIFIF